MRFLRNRFPIFLFLNLALIIPAVAQTAATAKAPARTPAAQTQLIPREVLFGNPEKASPSISPDGHYLSYLAPDNGVLNVWVRWQDRRPCHHRRQEARYPSLLLVL